MWAAHRLKAKLDDLVVPKASARSVPLDLSTDRF
jgi:hypothetical protein